jgi:excinuclease ABC subunit A
LVELDQDLKLQKTVKHNIEVVVDRLKIRPDIRQRLAESIEVSLKMGSGLVIVENVDNASEQLFSEQFACMNCGISYEEIEPRMFSFNSPYGACTTCDGLGTKLEIDPRLIVPNPNLSINAGTIVPIGEKRNSWYFEMIEALSRQYEFSLAEPWKDLPEKIQQLILFGTTEKVKFIFSREESHF